MKEAALFYREYLAAQHIFIYGLLLWWAAKKKISAQFLFGYLSFTSLALSGAMGHMKYTMNLALGLPLPYKIAAVLIFFPVIFLVGYSSLKKKIMPLFFSFPFFLFFLFLDRRFGGVSFAVSFWEQFAFFLFVFFVLRVRGESYYLKLSFGFPVLFVLPLFAGLAYPMKEAGTPLLFSPCGIYPDPTLLLFLGLSGIGQDRDASRGVIFLSAAVFSVAAPFSESLKIFKMLLLASALFYCAWSFFPHRGIKDERYFGPA
ncbi:MAG TPA: hypothetical protein VJC03_07465 [bacterium]|nr:hypothetical protein [bacterium]